MKALTLFLLIMFLTSCTHTKNTMINNAVPDSLKVNEIHNLQAVQNRGNISVVTPAMLQRTITVGGEKAEITGYSSKLSRLRLMLFIILQMAERSNYLRESLI